MKNYSIRLKDDQVKQLNKVATDQQRDTSFIVRAAIDSYLNIAPSEPTKERKPVQTDKAPKVREQKKQPVKRSEKDFDSWFDKATPSQRKEYFNTGVMV